MNRILVIAMLLVAFIGPSTQAIAQVDRDVAEQLMRRSGLWEQLASVGPQIRVGIMEAARNEPSHSSAKDVDRIIASFDTAFSPMRLRSAALRHIAATMKPNQVSKVMAWYDSALGRSITSREEAASRRDPVTSLQEGQAVLAAASAGRVALLGQVADVTKASEIVTNLTINVVLAVQRGAAAARFPGTEPALGELRARLELQRPQMREAMDRMTMASFASMYSTLGDSVLKKYIGFLKTESGMTFTVVGVQALDRALVEAATDVGKDLSSANVPAKI